MDHRIHVILWMWHQSPLKTTPVVFDAPVEHEVLNAIAATLQGWVGEQGHLNHISPSTCAGGESSV